MTDRNPQTLDEARAFVARVESLVMPWNIHGLLASFTEDCVICIADLPKSTARPCFSRRTRSPAGLLRQAAN
jgi:hypothetical protein